MRSYLDTIRKPVSLPLLPGEEVIKYYTASYDIGSSLSKVPMIIELITSALPWQ